MSSFGGIEKIIMENNGVTAGYEFKSRGLAFLFLIHAARFCLTLLKKGFTSWNDSAFMVFLHVLRWLVAAAWQAKMPGTLCTPTLPASPAPFSCVSWSSDCQHAFFTGVQQCRNVSCLLKQRERVWQIIIYTILFLGNRLLQQYIIHANYTISIFMPICL